ncbi:DUF455 domain-containing protein [Sphingomonas antarctica]|uniref:DUF455 family protein n=1 Tax=Sphingomonas antarctica TaxID=2040274 RepID=UPI0039E75F18
MTEIGYFQVDGMTLREEPARENCFEIVYRDADMHEYLGTEGVARRETLHRHMTNEMTSIDIAAACVAEFPDAPWDLRMELARQCWDEARHVRALHRRLVEVGGYKGEFPISTLEWSVTCALDTLIGRLTTQNRTLEAGAMDVVGGLARNVRASGDEDTACLLEAILADEVQHVRFANRWIKKLVADDRRLLMKVAHAVRFLMAANAKFQIRDGGEVNAVGTVLQSPEERIPAVNVADRKLAEFSDDEIHEILSQAGFRTLVQEPLAA